jgi:glycosyltransferase involved in cell wall biosynthesis
MVFVSESSQDEFKELFRDFNTPMSQIIYNPVNEKRVKKLAKLSDGLDMSDDVLNLICVGSLLPVKNYSMLFKALKILSMEGKDYHLYLCGVGPLESDLKEEIKTLGLFDNITLLGFQENPYKFISKSDLFIMPSISEALPTALIEAMILGKPVLVTDVSGCREVVSLGKNGLLVDCSVDGLAKGLRQVMDRPQLLKEFQLKSLERSKDFSDDRFLIFFYELIGFKSDH